MQVRQLLGMQFYGQTQLARGREDTFGLVGCEPDAFAKSIHRVDQTFGCQLREHFADHQIDIIVSATGIFWWHGMSAEKCGTHIDTACLSQRSCDLEHASFRRKLEAVAGLDFDSGHALGDQGIKPKATLRHQLHLAGRACCVHGRNYAATGS